MFNRMGIALLSGVLTLGSATFALSQSSMGKAGSKTAATSITQNRPSMDTVRQIQQALKDKGKDPGPIDGVMGPKTKTALLAFQRESNLTPSGEIDVPTASVLGVTMVSAEEAKGPIPAEPNKSIDETNPAGILDNSARPDRVGTATDLEDVRKLQMALKNRGYDPGEINGMVGSETQTAIRQFQAANSLAVSGVFDPQTQTALDSSTTSGYNLSDLALSAQASQKQAGGNVERSKPSGVDFENQKPMTDRTMDSVTMDMSKVDGKSPAKADKGDMDRDLRDRLNKSAEVLLDMTKVADKRIPEDLLQRAEAIAIIPHMVKGALGIGGQYGKGVVARRMDNGRWSAPAFVSIGGGSFGAQLGVSAQDLVLVFTDKAAVRTLENGTSGKLSVDAGVVAGPVGRTGEAGVTHDLKSGILAYSRAKGLFAGVALDGAVLDMDNEANHKVFGANAEAKAILNNPSMAANAEVRDFVAALERVAAKKSSEKQ